MNTQKRGFTLIEILLVIAIIAILAGIVIIAVNPSKQLGEANNAQRRSDVTSLMNAVYQYALDNNGNFPSGIDATAGTSQVFGTSSTGCDSVCTATTTATSCLDLSSDLVPTYIVGIPQDPKTGAASSTDYYIDLDNNGRLVVGACDAEQSATIQIER